MRNLVDLRVGEACWCFYGWFDTAAGVCLLVGFAGGFRHRDRWVCFEVEWVRYGIVRATVGCTGRMWWWDAVVGCGGRMCW